MNEIMDIWIEYPFYGYRRITDELADRGMKANKEDSVRPYLLKGLEITSANQVWATDITYIKIPGGMVYLFALIDWHTRFVVGWKLANTMEACHAVEVLEKAIQRYGKPEIVNADQGSQFTGEDWIKALEAHKIKISHDGVGRCIDNIRIERLWWSIKYEHVHLYCHRTLWELEKGLEKYLTFYNTKRRHQGINKMRPIDLYLAKASKSNGCHESISVGRRPTPRDTYGNNLLSAA
jgi:putative transposase